MSTDQIYILCICILLAFIFFLLYKLYSFSLIILQVESAIEESLDVLNERYSKINKIAEKPIFFDSVEVRQVISEIKASHDAILTIANKLTYDIGLGSELKKEDKES
jgi:hypothetical protein